MADEIIGSIGVNIVGDYSGLQGDIDAAAAVAAAGGEQIAEALTAGADSADVLNSALGEAVATCQTFEQAIQAAVDSGMTLAEALASVTSASEDVSSGVTQAAQAAESAGSAAESASSQVEQLGQAAQQTGQQAQEAAGEVEAFGAATEEAAGETDNFYGKLIEVGEAFAFLEGLKELSTDALEASDSLVHAQIALTQLTGSAGAASIEIEKLDELGVSDGLSLPSVYTAATRMQALLGAGTDVPAVLASVANAAAAMNTPLETAVNAFDRMASSGAINARSLPQVGLSLQQLANAANVVDPALEATSDSITKLFKSLDQSERLQILEQAFQQFGGVAQQVAQETFGGEWQTLATQWEQTMADVGLTLQPIVTDLMHFASADIIAPIHDLVTMFGGLPPVVQDAVIAFVGLTAAAAATLGAIGAFGIAMIGVNEAISTVQGIMAALGITTTETAAAETEAAAAATALGAANAEAATETTALAAAEGEAGAAAGTAGIAAGVLSSGLLAVATAAVGVALNIGGAADAISDMTKQQGPLQGFFATINGGFNELVAAARVAAVAIPGLNSVLNAMGMGLQQTDPMLTAAANNIHSLTQAITEAAIPLTQLSAAQVANASAAQIASAAAQGTALSYNSLKNDVTQAANAMVAAQKAVNDTLAGTQAHQEAVNALGAAYQDWKNATAALTAAQNALAAQVAITSGAVRAFVEPVGAPFVDTLTAAADKTAALTGQLQAQNTQLAEDQIVLNSWVQAMQNGEDVLPQVSQALQQVNKDQQAITQTQEALGESLKDVNAAFTAAKLTAIDWTSSLGAATDAMAPFQNATVSLISSENEFYTALKGLKITLDDVGDSVSKQVGLYNQLASSSMDTLATEDAGWAKIAASVNKLAQTDLPQVIALYNQHIEQLEKLGATQGEILTNQENLLTAEIKYAQQTGEDATAQVIQLNNVKLAQQALADSATLLGDTYVGVENDIIKGLENMGSTLADAIVQSKNLGQAFIQVGQQIAETILTTIINAGMKALINSILEATNDVGGLAKAFTSLASSTTSALGSAGTAAAGGAANAAGGASAAAGAAASSATGIIGAIGSIGSMIAGIVGDIQTAHTQNILGEIEQNTRYLQIEAQKYFQQDSWAMQTGIVQTLDMIFDRLGDMWNTITSIMQAVAPQNQGGAGGNDQLSAIFNAVSQAWQALNQTLSQFTASSFANTLTASFSSAATIIANEMIAQFNVIQPLLSGISTQLTGIFTALTNIPKLATGTPYVPHDMLAYIHEGEAVLPKGFEPQQIPGGPLTLAAPGAATYGTMSSTVNGGNVGDVTFNIYQNGSPMDTVRQVATTLKTLSPKFAVLSN